MTTRAPGSIAVSVVVPTYERTRALTRCLAALADQTLPRGEFEVIVVDDGSATPPHEVIRDFADRMDVQLIVVRHRGPAAARNDGAAVARGPILAFTDDDCRPHPDWLRAIARHFEGEPDVAVGGRVVNGLRDNPYSEASQLLISHLYRYYGGRPPGFFCTNNVAFPAAGFRALGGFDPGGVGVTGEDRELCERWCASGRQSTYLPDAVVYHEHHLTGRTFVRQHWRYGADAVSVHRRRRARGDRAAEVRLSFYTGLLRYPFREHSPGAAARLGVLMALSQGAYALGVLRRLVGDQFPAGDVAFERSSMARRD